MMRVLFAVAAIFFFVLPASAVEQPRQKIQITSIGYRAIPGPTQLTFQGNQTPRVMAQERCGATQQI